MRAPGRAWSSYDVADRTDTSPLTRSPDRLRSLATILTLGTFAGTSAFAAGHLYNPSAPLQPAAPAAVAGGAGTTLAGGGDDDRDERPAATAAPTATPSLRSRTRTTITPNVGTTTRGARTRTGQS